MDFTSKRKSTLPHHIKHVRKKVSQAKRNIFHVMKHRSHKTKLCHSKKAVTKSHCEINSVNDHFTPRHRQQVIHACFFNTKTKYSGLYFNQKPHSPQRFADSSEVRPLSKYTKRSLNKRVIGSKSCPSVIYHELNPISLYPIGSGRPCSQSRVKTRRQSTGRRGTEERKESPSKKNSYGYGQKESKISQLTCTVELCEHCKSILIRNAKCPKNTKIEAKCITLQSKATCVCPPEPFLRKLFDSIKKSLHSDKMCPIKKKKHKTIFECPAGCSGRKNPLEDRLDSIEDTLNSKQNGNNQREKQAVGAYPTEPYQCVGKCNKKKMVVKCKCPPDGGQSPIHLPMDSDENVLNTNKSSLENAKCKNKQKVMSKYPANCSGRQNTYYSVEKLCYSAGSVYNRYRHCVGHSDYPEEIQITCKCPREPNFCPGTCNERPVEVSCECPPDYTKLSILRDLFNTAEETLIGNKGCPARCKKRSKTVCKCPARCRGRLDPEEEASYSANGGSNSNRGYKGNKGNKRCRANKKQEEKLNYCTSKCNKKQVQVKCECPSVCPGNKNPLQELADLIQLDAEGPSGCPGQGMCGGQQPCAEDFNESYSVYNMSNEGPDYMQGQPNDCTGECNKNKNKVNCQCQPESPQGHNSQDLMDSDKKEKVNCECPNYCPGNCNKNKHNVDCQCPPECPGGHNPFQNLLDSVEDVLLGNTGCPGKNRCENKSVLKNNDNGNCNYPAGRDPLQDLYESMEYRIRQRGAEAGHDRTGRHLAFQTPEDESTFNSKRPPDARLIKEMCDLIRNALKNDKKLPNERSPTEHLLRELCGVTDEIVCGCDQSVSEPCAPPGHAPTVCECPTVKNFLRDLSGNIQKMLSCKNSPATPEVEQNLGSGCPTPVDQRLQKMRKLLQEILESGDAPRSKHHACPSKYGPNTTSEGTTCYCDRATSTVEDTSLSSMNEEEVEEEEEEAQEEEAQEEEEQETPDTPAPCTCNEPSTSADKKSCCCCATSGDSPKTPPKPPDFQDNTPKRLFKKLMGKCAAGGVCKDCPSKSSLPPKPAPQITYTTDKSGNLVIVLQKPDNLNAGMNIKVQDNAGTTLYDLKPMECPSGLFGKPPCANKPRVATGVQDTSMLGMTCAKVNGCEPSTSKKKRKDKVCRPKKDCTEESSGEEEDEKDKKSILERALDLKVKTRQKVTEMRELLKIVLADASYKCCSEDELEPPGRRRGFECRYCELPERAPPDHAIQQTISEILQSLGFSNNYQHMIENNTDDTNTCDISFDERNTNAVNNDFSSKEPNGGGNRISRSRRRFMYDRSEHDASAVIDRHSADGMKFIKKASIEVYERRNIRECKNTGPNSEEPHRFRKDKQPRKTTNYDATEGKSRGKDPTNVEDTLNLGDESYILQSTATKMAVLEIYRPNRTCGCLPTKLPKFVSDKDSDINSPSGPRDKFSL